MHQTLIAAKECATYVFQLSVSCKPLIVMKIDCVPGFGLGEKPSNLQQTPDVARMWLAIATHPHKERVAIENLGRQGYETYCPMLRKTIKHARRSYMGLRPLFPGYIFASTMTSWRSMRSTLGVRRVISFGEQPCLLPDDFILSLRAREVDGAIIKPTVPYRVGQQVRMTSGAFDGLVATILEVDERQRLVLLLDILNQSVRVHTDVGAVREI